ncbi:MAG: 3-methyl-2-oxobutanoate hydroxymethyltransferase [SAR202 cluster bacterium]|nr:3-methyl-2-oxobutanoate hydroxymethyltransferase [SAR202 cluster bacterium]
MTGTSSERRKITLFDLQAMKQQGRKITMLSIPDYPMALLADRAGLDTILVGDSLAMTVLGYDTTVPVTMEEMLHHTKAVTRATQYAFVVGDMPFMSNNTSERDAIINAGRFMQEGGTDSVKVEGGANAAHIVTAIVKAGIPVMGHIGLTPQHISLLGGYRVQGRDVQTARRVIDDALAIEEAGAFAIILECVPNQISKIVTERLRIPTISYGAGESCDGQGLVAHDILGMFDKFTPKFVKKYAELGEQIQEAFEAYVSDVVSGQFPTDGHSFHINKEDLEKVMGQV